MMIHQVYLMMCISFLRQRDGSTNAPKFSEEVIFANSSARISAMRKALPRKLSSTIDGAPCAHVFVLVPACFRFAAVSNSPLAPLAPSSKHRQVVTRQFALFRCGAAANPCVTQVHHTAAKFSFRLRFRFRGRCGDASHVHRMAFKC